MEGGPRLIDGGLAVDERGVVSFVNDFDFAEFKARRFYVIQNHQVGYIRAWHGHHHESKAITVLKGSAVIGVLALFPVDSRPTRYILSDKKPQVLIVPKGYANGCMALEPDTIILHISDKTIDEAKRDDIRLPLTAVPNIWEIESR